MHVKCLKTDEEFKALKEEWNGLLNNSESNTVFLTWEWLFTWWKHFGNDKKLFIVVVRDETGKLVGIAPLCLKKVTSCYVITLNTLTFLGDEEVCSEYLDFIIYNEKSDDALRAIFDFLEMNANLWDVVLLSDLTDTSVSFKSIKSILDHKKLDYFVCEAEKCPYITLPDNYEIYLHGLSKNMRYNLKRRMRNLEKKYEAKFEIFDNSNSLEKAMENLFRLHKKRRQMIGNDGAFLRSKLMVFHKEIAELFHQERYLRIYYMSVNGEVVSILYGFRYNDRFYYYQSGIEPHFEKQSVGLVLMGNCIKDSIDNGLEEFDFLRGMEAYKSKWTQTFRKTFNLIFSSNNIKGKTYVNAMSLFYNTKNVIKRRLQ